MSDPKSSAREHEHKFTIDATPEAVWKAITEEKELVNWFPLTAELKPGEGGSITYGWGPELSGASRISVWKPSHHLRTSWMEATVPKSSSEAERNRLAVDWHIEGEGGRTVLRLVHSGFSLDAKWDEEFDATRRGWNFELGSLKHYLERHAGKKRHVLWVRHPVALNAAQTWERLTGQGGVIEEGTLDSLEIGERYRIQLSGGDTLEGVVQVNTPPTDFAGTARNFDDGLFRFSFETCMGGPEVNMWLSTWGIPASEMNSIETRWNETLKRVFSD